jgi:hypothetical protein
MEPCSTERTDAGEVTMLIFGGFIGFVVCFFLVAAPLAGAMAGQLGVALVIPVIGVAFSPPFAASIIVVEIIHIVLVLLLYVMIAAAIGPNVPISGPLPVPAAGAPAAAWQLTERFARGALIGMNACFTAMLTWILLPWLTQGIPALGSIMLLSTGILGTAGVVIAFANLLALDESICADRSYAAVLGWSSWIAAGSTVVNLVGFVFWLISIVASWFGSQLRLTFEWWTGSWVVHGGPLHITAIPTAYDLGNFLLVDPRLAATNPVFLPGVSINGVPTNIVHGATATGLTFHETGHTLNVAAFGSWFHLIGAIDENFIAANGANAYSELLPEGHARDSTRAWIRLWAPPLGPVAAGSNVPPLRGNPTVNGAGAGGGPASVVITAGDTLTLVGASASDPDSFPQGVVSPGVTPALGALWAIAERPTGSTAAVTAHLTADTTATFDIGGDYLLVFAVTDGIELASGGNLNVVRGGGLDEFGISVVEARITGPGTVAVGETITLSAATSAAGSAGAVGGVAAPPLLLAWNVAAGTALTLTPGAVPEEINVRGNETGLHILQLTVTEQFSAAGVSHSAAVVITVT